MHIILAGHEGRPVLVLQDNELQGTLVQRLQARVENMQRIALKVQNALDEIASALERLRAVVCWADPTASAFFLIIAMAAALLVSVLGLHTLVSFLLCWMVRPEQQARQN